MTDHPPTPEWDDLSPEEQAIVARPGAEPFTDPGAGLVQNLQVVDHAMLKLKARQARLAHIQYIFRAARKNLDDREAEETAPLLAEIGQYEQVVRRWHWDAYSRGMVNATVTLPSGNTTKVYTNTNVQPTITDEGALLAFLAEHGLEGEITPPKTTYPIRKADLNKMVSPERPPRAAEPGTKIPALMVTPDGERVEVPGLAYIAPEMSWKDSH